MVISLVGWEGISSRPPHFLQLNLRTGVRVLIALRIKVASMVLVRSQARADSSHGDKNFRATSISFQISAPWQQTVNISRDVLIAGAGLFL
jgi:hypothetical protein